MKKLVMLGMVGMIMMAGSVVRGDITATPSKAIVLNEDITVTVTIPEEGAEFVSGSWTGPNGLSGALNSPDVSYGITKIKAEEYSVALNDYSFVVTWHKDGEDDWNEHAEVTLYRHWQPVEYLFTRDFGTAWSVSVSGNASPNGASATISVGLTTAPASYYQESDVIAGNTYSVNNDQEMISIPVNTGGLKIQISSSIDGVLTLSTLQFFDGAEIVTGFLL